MKANNIRFSQSQVGLAKLLTNGTIAMASMFRRNFCGQHGSLQSGRNESPRQFSWATSLIIV